MLRIVNANKEALRVEKTTEGPTIEEGVQMVLEKLMRTAVWLSAFCRSVFSKSAKRSFATETLSVLSDFKINLPWTRIRAKYIPDGT